MLQIKTWCCSLYLRCCASKIRQCWNCIDTVSQFKLKVKGKHKLVTVVFQSFFSKFKKTLLEYCLQSTEVLAMALWLAILNAKSQPTMLIYLQSFNWKLRFLYWKMLMQKDLQKMYFQIFWEYLWFVQESCKHTFHNFKNAYLDVFLVIFISYYNAC